MADAGIRFDGTTLEQAPLGGAETAFASLAEGLASRGHEVLARNNCAAGLVHRGVDWAPLAAGLPDATDLYIANRSHRLLPLLPKARRRVFWIHNPARYLLKWRYLSRLWRLKPVIVFSGPYHAGTYPRWAPAGARVIIPYGISELFRAAASPPAPPGPRAVFTSNPLRSLGRLLDLWARDIRPRVPGAELHIFSGVGVYGAFGEAKAAAMEAVLKRAEELAEAGVVVRGPVPKAELVKELRAARVMLYGGDPGETFCLSLGEAQAAGVPCVVQDVGCVAERVIDGETGVVARDDVAFADAGVRLLTDDGLWRRQHTAAVEKQRRWGWQEAAAEFEKLLP